MIRAFLHRQVRAMERAYDYDATYIHAILDRSLPAFLKFLLFQTMSAYREGVPLDAKFAASLAGALHEDCGPCVQIVVNMAMKAGVAPDRFKALLERDFVRAGKDAALGFRFGEAVAGRLPGLDELIEEARTSYGEKGLISLAYSVASARVYPTIKRGMGMAKLCHQIQVGSDRISVKRAA